MKKITLLTLFFSGVFNILHGQSNNEIEDILNREINLRNYYKPEDIRIHLTFTVNGKGKAFDYRFLEPSVDANLQDKVRHIFAKVKWESLTEDIQKRIFINVKDNKFNVSQRTQQKIPEFEKFVSNKFVKINDTLYAATYEVTNAEYKEFLKSLNDSLRLKYRVDSAGWSSKFPYSYHDPLVLMYHTHTGYNNYPVVNVSLEAARKYCEWLTARKHKDGFIYRLPTEAEWMLIAHANPATGLPYPNGNGISEEGIYRENLRWIHKDSTKIERDGAIMYAVRDTAFEIDGGIYTVRADAYLPNDFGLFNIIGNAAELTNSGEVKGGSWFDLIGQSTVDKRQAYTAPDPRVGFRVVAQKIRKN